MCVCVSVYVYMYLWPFKLRYNLYAMKFPFQSEQFSGFQYIVKVVQPSLLSNSRAFSSFRKKPHTE